MPDLASLIVFPFLLVLFRIGSCIMIFPGFSDISVNMNIRIMLTVLISFAMFSIVEPLIPPLPTDLSSLVIIIFIELLIGITMGLGAKLFASALHVGGEMISFMAGLQAATLFDPGAGGNSTAPSLFLGIIGTMFVFATNLHHFIIEALVDSYQLVPAGVMPSVGDTAQAITKIVADLFVIGVKIAAPVVAVGFLGYICLGIFNRMIPQFQVFFVAMPLTIAMGLFFLAITLGGIFTLYADEMFKHAIIYDQNGEKL